MFTFVVQRLLLLVPMLAGISFVTFALLSAAPGDPFCRNPRDRGNQRLTGEAQEECIRQYGLDRPLPVRYLHWVGQVARGNLGKSIHSHKPVLGIIADRLPNTLMLSGISLMLALPIGIALGVISAVTRYSVLDHTITFLAFVGTSVPAFWTGLLLIYGLGVAIPMFPFPGMGTPMHFVLPVLAIASSQIAAYIRFQRSSMLDILQQDYIRTARAKGLEEKTVIMIHAWRNSLLPIITLMGLTFVTLVEGAVVIEAIYAWPGMGLLAIEAVRGGDHNVIMAIVMLSATAIVVGNMLADIFYATVDPRIRYLS